jgi:polyhydroxybutyrate depolymerase
MRPARHAAASVTIRMTETKRNAIDGTGGPALSAVYALALAITALLATGLPESSAAERARPARADRQTLVHDGVERSYVVRVPGNLARGEVPLVLVLHGGGGNADNAEHMTGFTALAQRHGFIVAYPEGSSRLKGRLLTWNAGHCCGHAMKQRIDDVGFIRALLDRLGADYPVDPDRIYVTGMSNGGMMSHRLGIELSDRIAAIAPVVAALFGDERLPTQPVSALMINGLLDKSVPHQGGPPGGRAADAWDGTPAKPALAQGAFWARANQCASEPDRSERDALTVWQYRCPGRRAVTMYLVKDSGHAWPGGRAGSRRGDTPGTSLDASETIWNFFATQAR